MSAAAAARAIDRRALVEDHLHLAKAIAAGIYRRLPRHQVDPRDLQSEAVLGLMDAAQKFDTARGVEFGAYARRRIQGAVVDHLRREDPVGRCERARMKAEGTGGGETLSLEDLTLPLRGTSDTEIVHAAWLGELRALFEPALESLRPKVRLVLRHYFWDEMSLREIGDEYGLSEGRISQLKQEGVRRLCGWFAQRGVEAV